MTCVALSNCQNPGDSMSEGGQDRGDSELNVRHGELNGAGDVERPNTRSPHRFAKRAKKAERIIS